MDASKTARRVLLPVIVVVLAVGYLAVVQGGLASAPVTKVKESALRGMASMSGTVSSAKPFKAAQVYIRNVDMRIMYMVFTNAGQFRAVSLFPGNYEISVTAKGFKSDVQKLAVKAGDNMKIKVSLQEVANRNEGEADPLQNVETLASNRIKVSFDLYENIYPSRKRRLTKRSSARRCSWNTTYPKIRRGKACTRRSMPPDQEPGGGGYRMCGLTRRATYTGVIGESRAGWSSSIRAPESGRSG